MVVKVLSEYFVQFFITLPVLSIAKRPITRTKVLKF